MENKVIDKIKKLMALSKSSNEHEAQLAMTRAQELLLKHHLTMDDIKDKEAGLKVIEIDIIKGKRIPNWKLVLAKTLSKNLRCKSIVVNPGDTNYVRIVGGEEDAEVVELLFIYAIGFIESQTRKLRRQVRKEQGTAAGTTDSYIYGFLVGLAEYFKEQVKANQEWGLVLIIPDEVTKSIKEKYSPTSKNLNLSIRPGTNEDAFKKGKEEGKSFNNRDNKKLK